MLSTRLVEDLALPVTGIEINSPSNGETINIDKPININGSSDIQTITIVNTF